MRTKKIYVSIGVCLVFLAIGFIALRSDVPTEPIIIYKETTPIKRSVTPTATDSRSADTDSINANKECRRHLRINF